MRPQSQLVGMKYHESQRLYAPFSFLPLTPSPDSSTETLWKGEDATLTRRHSFTTWIGTIWTLLIHCLLSVGVTILVLVYVEGRDFNVSERNPHVQVAGGTRATTFQPIQSDVVTFISAIIAILKCALAAWAASLCWRVAVFLMERRGLAHRDLKMLLNYGQLGLSAYSRDWATFIIGALLLTSLVANFSSPLLTGSISWVPSSRLARGLSLDPIEFDDIEDGTLTKLPDYYLNQEYQRQGISHLSAGDVSIGWDRSVEKGVLKRVSPSVEALAVNSTIENVTIPYFAVHSIQWVESAEEIPRIRDHGPIPILKEYEKMAPLAGDMLPFGGVVLIPNGTITPWYNDTLKSISVQETMLMLIYYGSGGDIITQDLPPDIYTLSDGPINLAFAWVTYSAGVGRCKQYQCVISSPSTIQNTTSIELEPHQLTYQSTLMMSVVALSIVAQNSSLPSPWNNINDYIEAVFVRAYSGSWSTLNSNMATGFSHSAYVPALSSLLARVDQSRMYIWLGIQLLVTLLGILFSIMQFRLSKHPLLGDTTLAAFHLDTTEIPESTNMAHSGKHGVFKIQPQGDRLKVVLG